MLGDFYVKIDKIKNQAEKYQSMYQKIQKCNQSLQSVQNNLDGSYGDVKSTISSIMESNNNYINSLKQMESALKLIVQQYNSSENKIMTVQVGNSKVTFTDGSSSPEGADEKEDDSAWDYIWEALCQLVLGDFTDDSNALGIALSIILGFVPVAGQIADVRDLIADIKDLIVDGPQTAEWVSLAFTAVAFIPGIGDFCKHGDELAPLFKNADDLVEGLGDAIKGAMKKGDELYSAVSKYADDFNEMMNKKILSKITDKVDDVIDKIPKGKDIEKIVKDFMDKKIGKLDETVSDFVENYIRDLVGVDDKIQEWISDGIDWIFGKDEEVGDCTSVKNGYKCVA